MKAQDPLSGQLRSLLSHLSERGTHDLDEVESDLDQARALLGQAVESLAASFLALHAAAAAQQESIDRLLAGAQPSEALAEELKRAREDIERHANAAVTGLQFQDLTGQLIARTADRVAGLRELLGGFGDAMRPHDASGAAAIAALADLVAASKGRMAALDGGLPKAVNQTHMESGGIELF
jgi:hypothetical protein